MKKFRKVQFECEGNPEDRCGGDVEFEVGCQEELECPHCGTIYMPQALKSIEKRASWHEASDGAINPKTKFIA